MTLSVCKMVWIQIQERHSVGPNLGQNSLQMKKVTSHCKELSFNALNLKKEDKRLFNLFQIII